MNRLIDHAMTVLLVVAVVLIHGVTRAQTPPSEDARPPFASGFAPPGNLAAGSANAAPAASMPFPAAPAMAAPATAPGAFAAPGATAMTPATGFPATPTTGFPATPTTGFPAAPTTGYTGMPATGFPGTGSTGVPGAAPATGYPAAEAAPGGGFLGGGGGATGAPAGFNPFAGIISKPVKVIGGERVYCAVQTGLMLNDAEERLVPEEEARKNYFDDGTHGDEIPDDTIWTNITVVRDKYMGPGANDLLRATLSSLLYNEKIDPMKFYGVSMVSLDSVSELNNALKIEENKDQLVRNWAQKWLARYRVNPDDVESPFYPLYIPPPPPIPAGEVPPGFDPNVPPGSQPQQGGPGYYEETPPEMMYNEYGEPMDPGVFREGEFQSSPSYRYFGQPSVAR